MHICNVNSILLCIVSKNNGNEIIWIVTKWSVNFTIYIRITFYRIRKFRKQNPPSTLEFHQENKTQMHR